MGTQPPAIAQARSHLDRRRNEDITKEGGQEGWGFETCNGAAGSSGWKNVLHMRNMGYKWNSRCGVTRACTLC